MKKKSVQIVGACWGNKGDRLMILALQEKLGDKYNLPLPVYLNTSASSFWGPKNLILMFLQAVFRSMQYLKVGRPGVVLDCSGYQYGDPWIAIGKALRLRLWMYRHFKKSGGKLVLLPMSLGPFAKPDVASTAAGVFQLAELVFTRDEVSRQHALSIGCPPARIKIFPDYSNMVKPIMPADPGEWSNRVCVTPSVRMLDKTSGKVSSIYLDAVAKCIGWLREHGMEPFLMVHDLEDRTLIKNFANAIENGIMVVDTSPLESKGIIASCRAVVGSRYHVLVSALSQGTPAIGTGWTHKYQALFQDYNCQECLVESLDSGSELEEALDLISEETSYGAIVDKLTAASEKLQARSLAMFAELEEFLDEA